MMIANSEEILEKFEKIEQEKVRNSLYGFPVREPDQRRNPHGRVVDIKALWSRHKEILQLDSMGYKGMEIAKMLNIHPVTVSNCLNSTLGKEAQLAIREERDEEYEQLREEVLDLTRKSLDVYREILSDESEGRKLKKETADTVVLELSGMKAPTRIESRSLHAILTPDEIEDFKHRGMAAAKAAGKLIDVGEGK